jgi:hypothetical protein
LPILHLLLPAARCRYTLCGLVPARAPLRPSSRLDSKFV